MIFRSSLVQKANSTNYRLPANYVGIRRVRPSNSNLSIKKDITSTTMNNDNTTTTTTTTTQMPSTTQQQQNLLFVMKMGMKDE